MVVCNDRSTDIGASGRNVPGTTLSIAASENAKRLPVTHRIFFARWHHTHIWTSGLILPFAAALAALCLPSSPVSAQVPQPAVTVAVPLKRLIANWDEFTGRFTPSQSVEVRPRVTGFVDALHFRDGQLVKAGDLLFTIDPRPYQIAVDSARADLERNNAAVDIAALEVRRGEPLAQSQALAQSQLDLRRSTYRQAQANRDAELAVLHTAELNLSWTEVRAPITGRVSDRRVDVGNVVTGGQTGAVPTLLTTIVASDTIYFEFEAAEADYLKYVRLAQSGQRPSGRTTPNPVEVKLQDETEWRHKGVLDFIDNIVSSRSGTIRGRGLFGNRDQLLTPGQFGRIRLWAGDTEMLLIPDTAIQSDQASKIVLVVAADGTVDAKPVILGQIASGLRTVRGGLTTEDRVIINGSANPFVRPGSKVTVTQSTIEIGSPS